MRFHRFHAPFVLHRYQLEAVKHYVLLRGSFEHLTIIVLSHRSPFETPVSQPHGVVTQENHFERTV